MRRNSVGVCFAVHHLSRRWVICLMMIGCAGSAAAWAEEAITSSTSVGRSYEHRLTRLDNPSPLLADYPEFIAPVEEETRYEAPILIDEPEANLEVRSWRFSYNVRGIIELPNRLRGDRTAVIMVHPWGIDDGQGWVTPEPAGVCDFCTPTKNHLAARHTREVIDPLLVRLRPQVALTLFSLPGRCDPIRRKLYRSFDHAPSSEERAIGRRELDDKLRSFHYEGEQLPTRLALSEEHPVRDYFQQIPGLDAGDRYNGKGFWELPIPVTSDLTIDSRDIVAYDAEGYGPLRDYLKKQGIRHILLTGYATDMCFCRTTAGYENLSRDFNVFLVGDATLATFPGNDQPAHATNAAISFASLQQLVTQVSWIRTVGK